MNKRKIIGVAIIVIIVFASSYFVLQIINLQKIKTEKAKQMDSLPAYCFVDISDNPFCTDNLAENKPVLLILFDPHCSSCEQEIIGIYNNKEAFSNVSIAMITMSDKESCNNFYTMHKLNELPTLHVLRDTSYNFIRLAGMIGAPETFVYNKDKLLIQKFTGEVKATTLIEIINEEK